MGVTVSEIAYEFQRWDLPLGLHSRKILHNMFVARRFEVSMESGSSVSYKYIYFAISPSNGRRDRILFHS